MKKYQILNFHYILSRIDLQKVDKESRSKLIALDIALGDIVDSHNEEVEKIKSRISKGHEDEIAQVSKLIAQLESASEEEKCLIREEIDSHAMYADMQLQLNSEINRRLMEDVSVDIEKVSSADLAQWCADSRISITLDLLREFRRAGLTL